MSLFFVYLIFVTILSSCGPSGSTSNYESSKKENIEEQNENSDIGTPISTSPKKPYGSCLVTGNLSNFEVKCTKDIQNFVCRLGGTTSISSGGTMYMRLGKISIDIKKTNAKTLMGSFSGAQILEFKLNHIDGSSSNIMVNKSLFHLASK